MKTQSPSSSSADFDFFAGTWHIAHRQLRQRLADCDEWLTFGGSCVTSPLLGGAGNVDDNIIDHPAGSYRAVTLRSFDVATGNWSIWWLDGRYPARIDVPMIGSFDQGKGVFYADDTFEGRPVRVRFLWHAHVDTPRWEQAFSTDGGKTWETNWIMDFSRA